MAQAQNRTRLWFALHGWMALPVWLFLFFVCVTGTIATVDKEIMWLVDPTVRAGDGGGAPRKPVNDLVEDVKRQIPGVHVNRIRFSEPYMAIEMGVSIPGQPNSSVWVNPYSGDVQRVSTGINFPNFIRALHGWLLQSWLGGTPIGWYAVCLLGLPLLGSVITGLVVYKRFWKSFTQPRLRLGKGSRVAWGDFHRLAGVWGLWFIIVISLTGLWFLVRGVMFDMHIKVGLDDIDIAREEAPLRFAGDPMPHTDLDAAIARVQAERPGTKLISVVPPEHALGTTAIYSRSSFPLLMEAMWLNPYSGAIVERRNQSNASAIEIITAANASLHYGNFGGLWVKLIWTFFGLVLSGLVLSGTVIWTKRTAFAPRPAPVPPLAAAALIPEGAE